MTADTISVLLGRPLSATEIENFDTYLSLAQSKLNDILCGNICAEHDTKKFVPRKGYRTLNAPIFSDITSLTVNGVALDDTHYQTLQGSNLYGDWFNSIVFNTLPIGIIEVEADWGFLSTPIDIQQMLAEQFAMASSSPLGDDLVQRKQVEDFSIQFKDGTKQEAFAAKYSATIAKYSGCNLSDIQHGEVRNRYRFGLDYARHIL